MKNQNKRLIIDLIILINKIKNNLNDYISHGCLNSEGKKIRLLIIKKFVEISNEKSYLRYLKKDREEDLIKLIKVIEEKLKI